MRAYWSLGAGLQEQASNHFKLRRYVGFLVSVEKKEWQRTVSCVLVILVYRITLITGNPQKTLTSIHQEF
jgi:uncharacterized membrane protein YbjE (DUF340 family)